MGIFSSILGAVAGPVLGGLFGSKKDKRQNQYNAEAQDKQNAYNTWRAEVERANAIEDLKQSMPRLRESAEQAGYNPLTALGAGGAPGYANLPSGVGQHGFAPKLASTSVLGNVVMGAADAFTGYAAEQRAHKNTMEQIKEVNKQRALGDTPRAKSVYEKTASNIKRSAAVTIPKKKGVADLGTKPENPQDLETYHNEKLKPGPLMVTNPSWHSTEGQTYVDPRHPDAEHAEQRYGDIAQELTGAKNIAVDNYYNRRLQNISTKFGRDVSDAVHENLANNPTADIDEIVKKTTAGRPRRDIRPPVRTRLEQKRKEAEEKRKRHKELTSLPHIKGKK